MRSRFDRRAKKLRIFAIAILCMLVLLTIIMVIAVAAELHSEDITIVPVENSKIEICQTAESIMPDITVRIIFDDESEKGPYSEHNISLEEWKDVPEWDIPQEYKDAGGCLPESVRTHLYNLCAQYNISYPLMLALIETESGYKWDAESSDGSCKGYAMINDKWHQERMRKLGVTDIYNPYGNLDVAVDFLAELFSKYRDENIALMCYNCGESGAERLLQMGIESTAYSERILQREDEIAYEIYGY